MSSTSLPSSEQDHSERVELAAVDVIDGDEEDEEFFEAEPLPILGRCRAIYTFEGKLEFRTKMLFSRKN